MNKRCSNWPTKLDLFMHEKRDQPFDWAGNNCCFFACDWIAILIGHDPAAELRAMVDSALSAARVLKDNGGVEGIAERICSENKWEGAANINLARRGDVVLWDSAEGPALGVCAGELSWFAGSAGVVQVATKDCRRAWRVG